MGKQQNLRKERRFRKCEKNGVPQLGEYRLFGKKMKYVRLNLTVNKNAIFRLKRVVKGRHWTLEDIYGSGDNDFDKVVEKIYKHENNKL